ncbi:MAG: rhomboid family intramembrane serine protease [Planctomycetia bacterium]|nr:rhomboid family intramembrane serine protease [Planctomycetia bacterium]
MPPCVDCGQETDRDAMFGPPDELRCRACVRKLEERLAPEPTQDAPTRGPYITYAVMLTSVATTLAFWSKVPVVVDYLPMLPRTTIWDGQVWRLFTTCFLHGDPLHLLFNLYWVWVFGSLLEQWLGPLRYTGLLVLFALGSSAAQFAVEGPAVGLSGVGFAFFGLFYALRLYKDFAAAVLTPVTVQIWVMWFFVCIALTYADVMPVGNTAHGVGAILGWLVGRAVLARHTSAWLGAVTFLVMLLTGAAVYQPWSGDYAWHQGYTLAQRGQYEEALAWYRRAARTYPEHRDVQDSIRALELKIEWRDRPRTPQEK